MLVQDGFIAGVYHYCDRWCDTCPFTSRCGVFTDLSKDEPADPNVRPVAGAPRWMTRLMDGINQAAEGGLSPEQLERMRPRPIAHEHQVIRARADRYSEDAHAWLRVRAFHAIVDRSDPRSVIRWFHAMIPSKIVRALKGLANQEPEARDWPSDPEGSAKVALLGIDRSHTAFLQLVERRQASRREVEPLVEHLVTLREGLERVFPGARAFVRPGFDEPDQVARLVVSR